MDHARGDRGEIEGRSRAAHHEGDDALEGGDARLVQGLQQRLPPRQLAHLSSRGDVVRSRGDSVSRLVSRPTVSPSKRGSRSIHAPRKGSPSGSILPRYRGDRGEMEGRRRGDGGEMEGR